MALTAGVLIASGLGLLLVLANTWVSASVLRYSGSTRAQKAWQCAIIWFVPVLGAALAWGLMRSDLASERSGDGFQPQDDQGVSGPEFHHPGLPVVVWGVAICLAAMPVPSIAADQIYRFTLPAKVQITVIEAPFGQRSSAACPGLRAPLGSGDHHPKTYVKSIKALFEGHVIDLDVSCMTDAWNGRPLQQGAIRYFGGWCDILKGKPQCAFRGVFADGSEAFVSEWVSSGNKGRRTVISSSSDLMDLFLKNIDPPKN